MTTHDRAWKTEADARLAMTSAEARRDYEVAAIAAIQYSDFVGARTVEGAAVIMQQAQVYATLHHAQNVVWVAENRRERMP